MHKRMFQLAGLALLAVMLSPAAVLDFYTYFGPEAPGATGSGRGFFAFDTAAQTLAIDVEWTGLSGTTTVAHIHCCVTTAGVGTVAVAVTPGTLPGFPVGVSQGIYSVVIDLTQTTSYTNVFFTGNGGTAETASAALLQGILDGKAYFNIHSTAFPPGEIRGFLQPVPEPGTAALAGIAFVGLLAWRRRRTA